MKKLAMTLAACALACVLTACGGGGGGGVAAPASTPASSGSSSAPSATTAPSSSAENQILGTWELESMEISGRNISKDQVSLIDSNYAASTLVFQDSGKVVLYSPGKSESGKWKLTSQGVQVDDDEAILQGGKLIVTGEINGEKVVIRFGKTSTSQKVPGASSSSSNSKSNAKSNSSAKSSSSKSGSKSNSGAKSSTGKESWRTFVSDFDKYVDKLINLAKSLKNNPYDTSLIAEASSLAAESSQWLERATKLEGTLSASERAECEKELLKIKKKLEKAKKELT